MVELRLSCIGHCQQPVSRALQKCSSECGRTIANTVHPMYDYNTHTHLHACAHTHTLKLAIYVSGLFLHREEEGWTGKSRLLVEQKAKPQFFVCVCVCVSFLCAGNISHKVLFILCAFYLNVSIGTFS